MHLEGRRVLPIVTWHRPVAHLPREGGLKGSNNRVGFFYLLLLHLIASVLFGQSFALPYCLTDKIRAALGGLLLFCAGGLTHNFFDTGFGPAHLVQGGSVDEVERVE